MQLGKEGRRQVKSETKRQLEKLTQRDSLRHIVCLRQSLSERQREIERETEFKKQR
jgi:hypothetical protein